MEQCYLERATKKDMRLLFEWTNDREVRANSFHTDEISWEEHQRWFSEKIEADNCEIYIMYAGKIPVGQIRLEYEGPCAVISYSVDFKYRGRGYGRQLLLLAEDKIRANHKEIHMLKAEVKADNIASRKKFEQLSYESAELVRYQKNLRVPAEDKKE